MRRDELGDLAASLAVAEARSFTRAAANLGTSQSSLSYTVRRLETRLGLRLLTRSTRSVTPTDAGERLVETLRPALDDIVANRFDAGVRLGEQVAKDMYLLEDKVASMLAEGQLIRVLDDWCPTFSGYHLYYPSRRQLTPAFELLKESLRYGAAG